VDSSQRARSSRPHRCRKDQGDPVRESNDSDRPRRAAQGTTPMSSGIYQITNKLDGRRYVGSACDIDGRWRSHRSHLTRGIHHSRFLQRAWIKHGAESFRFEVLESVPRRELLVEREQYWINSLKPEYNATPTAGSCLGRVLSLKTRIKISRSQIGRKNSVESNERRRASMIGKNTRPRTPEWKAKISATLRGRKRSAEAIRKQIETIAAKR